MPMNSAEKSKIPKSWINTKKHNLSTWWQRQKSLNKQKKKEKTSTTQRWRNLSPDEPPLPFLSLHHPFRSERNVTATSSGTRQMCSEKQQAPIEQEMIFKVPNQQDEFMLPSTSIYVSHVAALKEQRKLYTIPELSDVNTTNSNTTVTNTPENSSFLSVNISSSLLATDSPKEEEETRQGVPTEVVISNNKSNNVSSIVVFPPSLSSPSNSSSSSPISTNSHQKILFSSGSSHHASDSHQRAHHSSSSPSAAEKVDFVPICDWPSMWQDETATVEPPFDPSLQGNEAACQLVFCQLLVSAVHKSQHERGKRTKEMHLLLNAQGNMEGIKMIFQDGERQDYLQFGGNLQYIPPELFVNPNYHDESVNVWTLGVLLYKMLVGQYPFSAGSAAPTNDWDLIHRMMATKRGLFNSSNSSHLSLEVKDLLKRMLTPEGSRASLDLILFHPWIKSTYHESKQSCAQRRDETDNAAAVALFAMEKERGRDEVTVTAATTTMGEERPQKKKKKWVKMMKKVVQFIVKGPYPPSSPSRHFYYVPPH